MHHHEGYLLWVHHHGVHLEIGNIVEKVGGCASRQYRGNLDVGRPQFVEQTFAHARHRKLGAVVSLTLGHAGFAGDAGNIDDMAGLSFLHAGCHGLGHVKQPKHVDLEHATELLEIELFQGGEVPESGIVDEEVNFETQCGGLGKGRFNRGFIRYVAGNEGQVRMAPIRDRETPTHHFCACIQELLGE